MDIEGGGRCKNQHITNKQHHTHHKRKPCVGFSHNSGTDKAGKCNGGGGAFVAFGKQTVLG